MSLKKKYYKNHLALMRGSRDRDTLLERSGKEKSKEFSMVWSQPGRTIKHCAAAPAPGYPEYPVLPRMGATRLGMLPSSSLQKQLPARMGLERIIPAMGQLPQFVRQGEERKVKKSLLQEGKKKLKKKACCAPARPNQDLMWEKDGWDG